MGLRGIYIKLTKGCRNKTKSTKEWLECSLKLNRFSKKWL